MSPVRPISVHDSNESGVVGLEQVVGDGWKVVDLISALAPKSISDSSKRHAVQLECAQCYARRTLRALASYRKEGGNLLQALTVMWRFRRKLMYLDAANFHETALANCLHSLRETNILGSPDQTLFSISAGLSGNERA